MSDAEDFAAFQAWKASQTTTPLPKDETPPVTIADVLKTLLHSARLPHENIVRQYSDVIDAAFPADPTETNV
jgi:hypothetical protein